MSMASSVLISSVGVSATKAKRKMLESRALNVKTSKLMGSRNSLVNCFMGASPLSGDSKSLQHKATGQRRNHF
jgi:hypothetical protein